MTYCVDISSEEPIFLVNQHIGFDAEDGMGIDGAVFQAELLQVDAMGKKRIQVWINSPGGIVMDGYNIFSAILDSKTPVDTYAKGMVASIAGPIFMAGRKRYMTDYSSLMMHNPFGGDDKKQIGVMKDSIATMIAAKSKLQMESINALMDKTTWMNPSECMEKGFCTDIEVTSEGNKKWSAQPKAHYKRANQILNNLFKSINTNMENVQGKVSLSLIANYLGLNTEATENSILTEMQSRINSEILNKSKAEEDAVKMKKEMDKAKADMEEYADKFKNMEESYNALVLKNKADAEEAENKVKEAENASKTVKAKAMIEGFVTNGKIKAETANKWEALAVEDFDGIKNMLDELPLNKVGVSVQNKVDGQITGHNAASIMASINASKNK